MKIAKLEWGRIETEDGHVFKDAKIFPDGAREWDWNETGTRHRPGIQIADVEEIVAHRPDLIVLTRGQELVLEVPAETVRWIEAQGIEVIVDETRAARERMHALLAQARKVGGLFHSTC